MKIRCLAIDDEPMALEKLKNYIDEIPYLELVAACRGVHEAQDVLAAGDVDAMFIDINMPDVNGMDFVRELSDPPLVVFTTAYSEYAVESYKVHAADYILKPYDMEEFQRVAENLRERWSLQERPENMEEEGFVYLKAGTKILRVAFDDMLYVEGMNEYLKIHPVEGDPYLTYATFKNLMRFLPDTFFHVHRSYVVNMKYAVEIDKSTVKLKDGTVLPIGGIYKEAFMQYIKKHLVQK